MRPLLLRRAVAVVLLVSSAAPSAAHAEPTKRECVDAATRGQDLRDGGRLVESREAFAACVSSSCPAVVRTSCGEWLVDLDARISKISIRVVNAAERDVPDARIRVDESSVLAPGASIPLDPGAHTIHVEAEGERVDERITVVERESRTVVVRLPVVRLPAPPIATAPQTSPGSTRPDQPANGAVPTGVWLLGGTAILGLASFTFFGLSARSDLKDLRSTCAPDCAPSSRDAAERKAVIADVSLGIALVATVAAVVVYATSR